MRLFLNWLSKALGLDIQFDVMGVFLFFFVVIVPIAAMAYFWRLARKYQRPVAWIAAVPIGWWGLPGAAFALREPLQMKALPLLGIALGCAGFIAVFVAVGGKQELEQQQPHTDR